MDEKKENILAYIEKVNDPIVREAMKLHYINGLTWNEAAHQIGGNTADSLRMMVKRYMRQNPKRL